MLELNLFSGLAGIGFYLLHLGELTGEPEFIDLAYRIVDITADRLGGPDDVPAISGGANPHAGLMYGSAGVALLFLHAYERTGDAALLYQAAVALRQDLRRCVKTDDGSLQVNQDWRTLPYLDEGSAGIGLVLARYLAHRDDETFTTALNDLWLATQSQYYVQAGLFTGRAGMIACLGMGDASRCGFHERRTRPRSGWANTRVDWGMLCLIAVASFSLGTSCSDSRWISRQGRPESFSPWGTALHDRPMFLPFFEPPGDAGTPPV